MLPDESHPSGESNNQIKVLVDRPTLRLGPKRRIRSTSSRTCKNWLDSISVFAAGKDADSGETIVFMEAMSLPVGAKQRSREEAPSTTSRLRKHPK